MSVFARLAGLDRDRAFYPTVLVVVASYYVLFAVMGGSVRALVLGTVMMGCVHAHIIDNPGVPEWWPAFCGAYDVVAAAALAWLSRGREA